MPLSLILAQRIIALFDEAGATKDERYEAVQVATVLIPSSARDSYDDPPPAASVSPPTPSE